MANASRHVPSGVAPDHSRGAARGWAHGERSSEPGSSQPRPGPRRRRDDRAVAGRGPGHGDAARARAPHVLAVGPRPPRSWGSTPATGRRVPHRAAAVHRLHVRRVGDRRAGRRRRCCVQLLDGANVRRRPRCSEPLLPPPPRRGPAAAPPCRARRRRAQRPEGRRPQPGADTARSPTGSALASGWTPRCAMSLAHAYERWDGKGLPDGLAGEEIPAAVRGSPPSPATWRCGHRSPAGRPPSTSCASGAGTAYDPAVVDVLVGERRSAGSTRSATIRPAVLASEPEPVVVIDRRRVRRRAGRDGRLRRHQVVWTRGHSTGVAELVDGAARAAGLDDRPPEAVAVGGTLVHDVGRVGVAERDLGPPRPAHRRRSGSGCACTPTSRSGSCDHCDLLAPLAAVRPATTSGPTGPATTVARPATTCRSDARLLAAADAYHAMTEARPHRPARRADAARRRSCGATWRRALGRGRRRGVLAAAGGDAGGAAVREHRPGSPTRGGGARPHRPRPRQQAGRRRARHLPQDRRQPHRAHLRQDRRRTRAGATLFAMEHGLVAD